MVLAWKQPTFIGGADITGYFVDYREVIDGVPGKWHEANIKAVSERAYRVGWYEKTPSEPEVICAECARGECLCVFVSRCPIWRRIRSTSFRCEQPTWLVSASRRCPVIPSCVKNGPLLSQVGWATCFTNWENILMNHLMNKNKQKKTSQCTLLYFSVTDVAHKYNYIREIW